MFTRVSDIGGSRRKRERKEKGFQKKKTKVGRFESAYYLRKKRWIRGTKHKGQRCPEVEGRKDDERAASDFLVEPCGGLCGQFSGVWTPSKIP